LFSIDRHSINCPDLDSAMTTKVMYSHIAPPKIRFYR
jgi:hypothetical protein